MREFEGFQSEDLFEYLDEIGDIPKIPEAHDIVRALGPRCDILRFTEDVEGFEVRFLTRDELVHSRDGSYGWVLLYPENYKQVRDYLLRREFLDPADQLTAHPMWRQIGGNKPELWFEQSRDTSVALLLDFDYDKSPDDSFYDNLENFRNLINVTRGLSKRSIKSWLPSLKFRRTKKEEVG